MSRYSNDPRQMTARFSGQCSKCNAPIKKGAEMYWWPSSRQAMCEKCGEPEYRQFQSSCADEAAYAGYGNPY